MNSKQKKPIVKVTVALISVLGITAIGVGSALAIANKNQFKSSYQQIKCYGYNESTQDLKVRNTSIDNCENLIANANANADGRDKNGYTWWY
ncbi:hypothetical protein [Nodularia sp. LEGE 04288]|uniref:hypothetical protein n=1 Tax=Nodularia sp. LEGE 04288 TaxID=1828639 RepID=UPI001D104DC3|nr:hypothetical protein [Nodularia sp. LEGE 04288]MCC2695846.1 hypothetical protein [Nodularia sp. LEGE 04288]